MKHLIKPTIVLMVCSLFGQFVAFLTNVVTATLFGASADMDAFLAAQTLPAYVGVVVVGGLGYVFIPLFIENRVRQNELAAWELASSVITVYVTALLVVCAFGIVFARELLVFTVPGLPISSLELAVDLARIMWPTAVLTALLVILSSIYHAYERFLYHAITTVIVGFLYVAVLVIFGPKWGVYSLAVGLLLSTIVHVALLLKIAHHKYHLRFNVAHSAVLSIIQLQLPILWASVCANGTKVFERFVASDLSTGSISYLAYADKIKIMLSAILGGGIAITLFPMMARNVAEERNDELKRSYSVGLTTTWIVTLPVIWYFGLHASEIVRVVFERGQFQGADTRAVAEILPWYLLSMIGAVLGNITSRMLYVLKRTKIVAYIGTIQAIIFILVTPFLTTYFRVSGIAVAIAIIWNLSLAIQMIALREYLDGKRQLVLSFTKITLVGTLSSFLGYFVANGLFTGPLEVLIFSSIIMLPSYGAALWLMKLTEVQVLVRYLSKRFA